MFFIDFGFYNRTRKKIAKDSEEKMSYLVEN